MVKYGLKPRARAREANISKRGEAKGVTACTGGGRSTLPSVRLADESWSYRSGLRKESCLRFSPIMSPEEAGKEKNVGGRVHRRKGTSPLF